jgi:DNA-binding NarL/FixJ family response regulator
MSDSRVPGGRARVLIVDDHPIVRQGMKLMVNAEPDLEICGEAQNEQDARLQVRALKPDVVIVDLSLEGGDGFNVVRDIAAHFPHIRALVLSMHDESVYAEKLLSEGASGYIMKQAATDQLITAIRTVLRGERFLSESLQRNAVERGVAEGRERATLSARELQVISLIGRGVGTRRIAHVLSVSVKTIETHRLSIKRKLVLDTNAQLVQYGIKWHGAPGG